MTEAQIKELLQESEGTALDFKRDQYPFASASDDIKSELLKDILAFANSFRRTDAFILIGVDEAGGAPTVVGIPSHIDDAALQQFVNSKTNRPIEFAYETARFDGKAVGCIRVPVQRRPFFLKQDFGRIKARAVYFRRGSSTAVADADAIALMGQIDVQHFDGPKSPRLELVPCEPETRQPLDLPIPVKKLWLDPHSEDALADFGVGRGPFEFSSILPVNRDFWRDLADLIRFRCIAFGLLWRVENESDVTARNVIVTVEGVVDEGNVVFEEALHEPDTAWTAPPVSFNPGVNAPRVRVDQFGARWRAEAHIGDVQPGTTRWATDPILLGWRDSGKRTLEAVVTADNLAAPKEFRFDLELSIDKRPALTQEQVEEFDRHHQTNADE